MDAVIVLGDGIDRGTYLLRMQVTAVLRVQFGRFNKGEPIVVSPGAYLYVGSALRGLSSRLIRHASRCDVNNPQPIRDELLRLFPQTELPRQKKLHWHIDYLVEETAVTLSQIILIQHPARLEGMLAQWLNNDPHTIQLANGLGASDGRGTHLLQVMSPGAW